VCMYVCEGVCVCGGRLVYLIVGLIVQLLLFFIFYMGWFLLRTCFLQMPYRLNPAPAQTRETRTVAVAVAVSGFYFVKNKKVPTAFIL